jgi:hypothetical protein
MPGGAASNQPMKDTRGIPQARAASRTIVERFLPARGIITRMGGDATLRLGAQRRARPLLQPAGTRPDFACTKVTCCLESAHELSIAAPQLHSDSHSRPQLLGFIERIS